jgi:hypothetical protein
MLGSPVIKVELSEAQVSTCINKAIQRYMQFKTPEPTYYYMDLSMHGGNGMVELPVFIPKEEIIEVTYSPNIDTFTFAQGGGDIFMSYFMQMNNGQLLTDIYIAMSYKETYQRVLGIQPTYELVSGRNSNGDVRDFIRLHPVPTTAIKMALLYNRAISEKEADQVAWIHKYALTWAKEILGRTRSKYSSVPGPTGEITLDGNALLQEAFTDREKLDSELVLVSEPLGFSMG